MFKACHSPGEKYCQLKLLLLLLLPRVIYFFSSWEWNFGETLATQFSRIKLHKVPRTLLPNCYVVFLFLISWQAARPARCMCIYKFHKVSGGKKRKEKGKCPARVVAGSRRRYVIIDLFSLRAHGFLPATNYFGAAWYFNFFQLWLIADPDARNCKDNAVYNRRRCFKFWIKPRC